MRRRTFNDDARPPFTMQATDPSPVRSSSVRVFGRFELRQLLGKSDGSMSWLAFDPASRGEVMLCLPRMLPLDTAGTQQATRQLQAVARLKHPNLAPTHEIGVQDQWPYVTVDRACGVTLTEWLGSAPLCTPAEAVFRICQLLDGLAYAHEAGLAHHDLQPHNILVNERGELLAMALGVNATPYAPAAVGTVVAAVHSSMDAQQLQLQRNAAQRDVLACGLLLHHWLCSQSALGETDISRAATRLPPLGNDVLRLPRAMPQPVPESLRTIVNRTTTGQERQRYLNARTLLRALRGWHESQSKDHIGPVHVLLDRLRTVGHLPALPGLAARVARLTTAEGQRTDEIASLILEDPALSFELLRTVNSAQVQGTQAHGSGPVLTLRRAVALLGVNGVRQSANALRSWPGPLGEVAAAALRRSMEAVALAGHAAQALRPAGYDAEVTYLVTILQNLGRMLVLYHFSDEAEQVRQLMQPLTVPAQGDVPTVEHPGMGEEAAAWAVLGVDIETLGVAVARHWGLGEDVLHMIRRIPAGQAVRKPDSDADMLRIVASAANDAVDVLVQRPPAKRAAAMAQVAQRYTRALSLGPRDLLDALQVAQAGLRETASASGRRQAPNSTAATQRSNPGEAVAVATDLRGTLASRHRAG